METYICHTILRDIICLFVCHVNNHFLSQNMTKPTDEALPYLVKIENFAGTDASH